MRAYYNECDPDAVAWLRGLMAAGLIPEGDIDARRIEQVQPADVVGYTHRHWFAGIGGWARSLQLAGWPDERPIDTASCPCPPFSSAGKKQRCPACGGRPVPCPRRTGHFICLVCEHAWFADARHLWPEVWRLLSVLRPSVVLGEQVAGTDGLLWLAGVRSSLERLGYGVGAADLCAAGAGEEAEGWIVRGDQAGWEPVLVGAPHIRQRLYWVARWVGNAHCSREDVFPTTGSSRPATSESGRPGRLADAGPSSPRRHSRRGMPAEATGGVQGERGGQEATEPQRCGTAGGMGDTSSQRVRAGGRGEDAGTAAADQGAGNQRQRLRSDVGDDGTPDRLANSNGGRCSLGTQPHGPAERPEQSTPRRADAGGCGEPGGLGHAIGEGSQGRGASVRVGPVDCASGGPPGSPGGPRGVADSDCGGCDSAGQHGGLPQVHGGATNERVPVAKSGSGFWTDFTLVPCTDGKARRTQSGLFPLADGVPFLLADGRTRQDVSRAQVLKGIGNAIVPPLAAEFIRAFLETDS